MSQDKRIFIVGHPGAGKALVAKMVAEKLGWQFINSDLGLETSIGLFLAEIVGKPQGVESFFQCQTKILTNQLTKEKIVVGTDASLLASEKNRQLLASEFVVYLKVSTAAQLERTSKNPASLLPISDYTDFLDKLHHERDSVYEKAAKLIINTDDNALEEHVLSIVNAIKK